VPVIYSTLIATLGTEPQVVTAAFDLLCTQGENIRKVIVIHTSASLPPIASAVKTVQAAFKDLDYPARVRLDLVPIIDEYSHKVDDVDTPHSTRAAFQTIYKAVWEIKTKGGRVHLVIAGGRKTMAIFGMAAAQLLFDENDRLWHLFSSGDFLTSKRLHPGPEDDVHLEEVPVILWSQVSPVSTALHRDQDPYQAIERVRRLQFSEKIEASRSFILGSLTAAERQVVVLLVKESLSNLEIAQRLGLSHRTIEQHLRSVFSKAAAHWDIDSVNRVQLVSLLTLYFSVQI
jgi:CRISPR-associated protein Csx14